MYRGFNLDLSNQIKNENFTKIGKEIFVENKKTVKNKLDDYLLENSSLNGTKIIEDWFPSLKSHIFLSHSHKDEELAFLVAGLLKQQFDMITFIDSAIWGYSNDLLKMIDDKYCRNIDNENYSYEKRNYSTSHVHLMLSTALNKMIDNCECIFFLNTPNSLTTNNEISKMSNSPWIFSEISTTSIIRKKTPIRLMRETKVFSNKEMTALNESMQEKLNIEYNIELSHLTNISGQEFLDWVDDSAYSPENALDKLYKRYRLNKKFYTNE